VPSYGLIVEGIYDKPVYETLAHRLDSPDAVFFTLECGGVGNLMKQFPGLLKSLEFIDDGKPVDRALVIRDCGNRLAADVESEMRAKIAGIRYRFPRGVDVCAVRQETETWILADEQAISNVADGRIVGRVNGDLEDMVDPKERLLRILSRVRLDYLPSTLGSIARCADVEIMRYRLPAFRSFEQKI
jgi:hypothetical protein